MPSIFLSHTSVDKPFVEKLAVDLKGIGVAVWYDKWEIKVGDSLIRKIESGIQECEYLAIVLSPEAVHSEWVRNELGAAWAKQIRMKRIVVLPIFYRDCEMPALLEDRRYADFRIDYNSGFAEVAQVLGVAAGESVSRSNWRMFAKTRSAAWQKFRDLEFEDLVTTLVDRAREYNWSSWVGRSKTPYSITLSASSERGHIASVSMRLDRRDFAYRACLKSEYNPNNLKISDFDIYVGNSVNECEEYVWRYMDNFKQDHGVPAREASHFVHKYLNTEQKYNVAKRLVKETSWYQGEDLL